MNIRELDPIDFINNNRVLLASLPLCAGAPIDQFVPFLSQCKYLRLEAGDLLLEPSAANHHLYVLLDGEIVIYIDSLGSDKSFPVAVGELVGEISIIDGLQPTSFVAASSEAVVLAIHEDVLWTKYFQIPGAARNLLRLLALRMRERNSSIQKSIEQTLRLEHLERELHIAHDLQASMLPAKPLLPGSGGVAVDALMIPAKEIGGDFYDAFALDNDRVCVAIGDVAGKGIPAALFMVRCLTLLRTELLQTKDPLMSLQRVNALLCADNPMSMFVTLSICVVDTRNSTLEYVNGGHNPVLLGSHGRGYEFLKCPKGMLVGVNPLARYEVSTHEMRAGDILLLYTDGITEAMNIFHEEFSNQRLLGYLNQQRCDSVSGLIAGLRAFVQEFVGAAEQSDDLTVLALSLRGAA